ncbi:MAG TPA: hypothetical protein VKB19_14210 [Pedobacter sp.]|nr:hypothetical protein [Pedobacter sp.]
MVFIVIIVVCFLLQMVLPWWIIIVISFAACGLIGKTGKISFWSPFLAILLLWTGVALFKSLPNGNLLASRVAEMFGVKLWWAILVISSLLGALASGISGYCGYHFRKAVLKKKAEA